MSAESRDTDLQGVKRVAKQLIWAVDIELLKDMPLCNHPYTMSNIVMIGGPHGDVQMIDITDKDNFKLWANDLSRRIDSLKRVIDIYILVRDPYKLTFLKFVKEYLSEEDFTELFADAWVDEENPNMDANVSLKTAVSWFKECKKELLMVKEDLEYYNSLPDEVTVYRGVAVGRVPNGLSWTDKLKTAKWFAHRYDKDEETGYVQKAVVPKSKILAYFNTRNEDELVVDTFAIKNEIEIMEE